jgi:F-type H+-transporting ATPase subunit a
MSNQELAIDTVFSIGPLEVTNTVITTWGIIAALGLFSWLSTRQLSQTPGSIQTALEATVATIENAVAEVAPQQAKTLTPFIGSLWVFLVIANLSGLIPGLHSPTRDLSATSAMAIVVFLSAHWFGIRAIGIKNYLRHYLRPSPILLPFHLVSEITRTVALAVRLFGNMMSLEMAALLILLVAGFLAPVPILLLHIIEALVQAYIFGMLALVYVAGGIQSQQLQKNKNQSKE